jgi:hypothetical protein
VKIADGLGRLGAGNPLKDSVRDFNHRDLMTHSGSNCSNLQSDVASTDHEDAACIDERLAEQLSVVDRPKSEYACQTLRNISRESPRPRSGRHDQSCITKFVAARELDLMPSPIDAHDALSRSNRYARSFKEFLRAKAEAIHRHLTEQKSLGERRPLVRHPRLIAHDSYFAPMSRLAQTDSARKRGLASSYNDDIVPHLLQSTHS